MQLKFSKSFSRIKMKKEVRGPGRARENEKVQIRAQS
jgi:hypothetical protein